MSSQEEEGVIRCGVCGMAFSNPMQRRLHSKSCTAEAICQIAGSKSSGASAQKGGFLGTVSLEQGFAAFGAPTRTEPQNPISDSFTPTPAEPQADALTYEQEEEAHKQAALAAALKELEELQDESDDDEAEEEDDDEYGALAKSGDVLRGIDVNLAAGDPVVR